MARRKQNASDHKRGAQAQCPMTSTCASKQCFSWNSWTGHCTMPSIFCRVQILLRLWCPAPNVEVLCLTVAMPWAICDIWWTQAWILFLHGHRVSHLYTVVQCLGHDGKIPACSHVLTGEPSPGRLVVVWSISSFLKVRYAQTHNTWFRVVVVWTLSFWDSYESESGSNWQIAQKLLMFSSLSIA